MKFSRALESAKIKFFFPFFLEGGELKCPFEKPNDGEEHLGGSVG